MTTKSKLLIAGTLATAIILGTVASVVVKANSNSSDTLSDISNSGEVSVQEASTKKGEGGLPSETEMIKLLFESPYGYEAGLNTVKYRVSKKTFKQPGLLHLVEYMHLGTIEDSNNQCVKYNYRGCFEFTETTNYVELNDFGSNTEHAEKGETFYIEGYHRLCKITVNGKKFWKDMKTNYLFD